MRSLIPRSLKGLVLFSEGAFVVLLLVTGGLGVLSAYHWQQSSAEAVRINALLLSAQQIRADMYGQVEEVIRARLTEDPSVLDRFAPYSARIDERFKQLDALANEEREREAVDYMRDAYQVLRKDMDKVFTDPFEVSEAARMKLLDRAHEEWMLADFESAQTVFAGIMALRQDELNAALGRWTRLASVLVPLPLALAVLLVVLSVLRLHRLFLKPMQRLTDDVLKLSSGDFEHRVRVRGGQEVSALADAFNEMAAELARSRDALLANERQAALGALVPVVAHNIRNPLASIRATAQVMDAEDSREDLVETRQAIIDSVDQLERWVRALLSYLHPLKPRLRRVCLKQVVDAACILIRPKLEQRGIVLKRVGFDEDRPISLDPDLMEQAVYGLLNNAVEASPEGATICLLLEHSEDLLTLQIEDRGAGMRVTPRPTDLTPGPSTKPYGTGLGIPFAYKVVHAHGGEIVFARAEPVGTRVTLTFPSERVPVRGNAVDSAAGA